MSNDKRTLLNDERINDAIETLSKMQKALKDTLSGSCMIEACQKNGLNYSYTRNILISKSFGNCRMGKAINLEQFVALAPDGYWMLYADLFDISDMSEVKIPPDYKDTVLDVLQSLTEREQKILCMRYGIRECENEGLMTLEQIEEKIGISKERVRQVEKRALRKLRHPIRSNQLIKGSAKYYAEQQIKDANIKAHKEAVDMWRIEQIENAKYNADPLLIDRDVEPELINISELELSVRSYNALKRINVNTLQDLLDTSDEQLMKARNLGRKSFEEIKEKRDSMMMSITAKEAQQ